MKVSVIIRTYNRAYILAEAVESALAQTYQDFEIVIVDDGSTDDTAAIVQQFSSEKLRYVLHEKNRGVGAACNSGISAATGELIALKSSKETQSCLP
jgi:glycosyltransferase involved in cell wall biosynthesis